MSGKLRAHEFWRVKVKKGLLVSKSSRPIAFFKDPARCWSLEIEKVSGEIYQVNVDPLEYERILRSSDVKRVKVFRLMRMV